ncbi:MAG: signal peptidase II [Acidobacteria bacterium]|nr:signal peptidase II [Acidobacteriota bacterium]
MTLNKTALIGLIPGVFALDWISKRYVEKHVSFWDTYAVIPGLFSIVHAQNRGTAFSLLADAPDTVRALVLIGMSGVVTLVVAWMFRGALRRPETYTAAGRLALALVLGGALGNLYDRILRGSVTDFLLLYWRDWQWPVFNVADSAISVGAVLLLIDLWRQKETA